MKKGFAMLIVLLLLLSVHALGDELYTTSGGVINGYTGTETVVTVPCEIDGEKNPVLGSAFYQNQTITSLTVSEGIVALDQSAIYWNSELTELVLPDSLALINDYNVYSCAKLESVVVPANVRYIGAHSFYACDVLHSVTFLGKAPVISSDAFMFLADDAVIYVPDDCYDDYRAQISEEISVQTSGHPAQEGAAAADAAEFTFDAQSGTLLGYNGSAATLVIPSDIEGAPVKTISENFLSAAMDAVKVVVLPEGLEVIGDRAFNSTQLLAIFYPSTLREIGEEAFNWSNLCRIFYHHDNHVEKIGVRAYAYSNQPMYLELPEGIKFIEEEAFQGKNFENLILPASIERIAVNAFPRATWLKKMYFKGSEMPEIDPDAFSGCKDSLANVYIAWDATRDQLQKAQEVFAGLNLTNCTVWRTNPADAGLCYVVGQYGYGATYVNGYMTSYSESLSDVSVPEAYDNVNIIGLGEGVFRDCQTIRSFYPHHRGWFTTIGKEAFANSSVQFVEMFDSITTIESGAFRGCTGFTEMTFPVDLVSVAADAFEGCTGLQTVKIDCDPNVLPGDLFIGCPLKTVIISSDLTPANAGRMRIRLGMPEDVQLIGPDGHEISFDLEVGYSEEGNWQAKPTDVTAVQSDPMRGAVTLTWKAGAKPDAFETFALKDGKNDPVMLALSDFTYDEENDLYTAVLPMEEGNHKLTLCTVRLDGDECVFGAESKAVNAKVAVKWKKSKASFKATQVSEEVVHLSIKPVTGIDRYQIQLYAVDEKGKLESEPLRTTTVEETEVDITGLENTWHYAFLVSSALDNEVGAPSKPVKLKMKRLWATAPKIVSAEVAPDRPVVTLTVSYTSVPDGFTVLDGKVDVTDKTTVKSMADGTAELQVKSSLGNHKLTVIPYHASDVGAKSNAKSVKVSVEKMAVKLKLEKPVQTTADSFGGDVSLTWTLKGEADGFIVYEVIDKQLVELTDAVVNESGMTVHAEAGKHTYAVAPYWTIDGENWVGTAVNANAIKVAVE